MPPTEQQINAQTAAVKRLYAGVPPFVITGAHPKVGKTVDSLFALPNALVLYSDGGLKSSVSTVGWAPLDSDKEAKTVTAIITAVTERLKLTAGKGLQFKNASGQVMRGIIVDDFTLKVRAELASIQANPPKNSRGGTDYFEIWARLKQRVQNLITLCREMEQPIYFSTHLRDPGIDESTKEIVPGGPDVASAGLSSAVTGWIDLIQYIVEDPVRTRWPHGLSVNTRGGTWLAGDRHNVVSAGVGGQPLTTPLNTAEVLRAAGYILPRPLDMDSWVEPMIGVGLDQLKAMRPEATVLSELAVACRQAFTGVEDWQLAWLFRDLLDRHEIRTKSQRFNRLLAWGITIPT